MLILNPEFFILEWSSQKVCSVFKHYVPFRTVSYCICCEILLFLPSFTGASSSECHHFLIFLISCSASPCCALLPEYVLFISCLRERWRENRLSIQLIVIGWPHQASCPLCNGPPETGIIFASSAPSCKWSGCNCKFPPGSISWSHGTRYPQISTV
jgi:hypothetical protein